MKKIALLASVVAMLSLYSCSTVSHTASVQPIRTSITSMSTADLQVSSNKISYKYVPPKSVQRAGKNKVIETAVAEALRASGNSDVLVAFDYEIKQTTNLFGVTKIKYVIVEGYPAIYTNVKPIEPKSCPHDHEH